MTEDSVSALQQHIESAEESYEYLISYAGRGLDHEQPAGITKEAVGYLEQLDAAMEAGLTAARAIPDEHDLPGADRYRTMLETMATEVDQAREIIKLLSAQDAVTSAQVDNMNGMAVFQSVMMKFFFLDELTAHLLYE